MLTALGRSTFTVLLITGIVIRKMMSITSMTSTSGVVLMLDITDPPPPPPEGMLIAMVDYSCRWRPIAGRRSLPDDRGRLGRRRTGTACCGAAVHAHAAHQVRMQIGGEVAQRVLQDLVAAE